VRKPKPKPPKQIDRTKAPEPDHALEGSRLLPTLLLLLRKLTARSRGLFEVLGSDCSSFIAEGFGALQRGLNGFVFLSRGFQFK
jgi:hypothetical protein